eukprot:gene8234-10120_t
MSTTPTKVEKKTTTTSNTPNKRKQDEQKPAYIETRNRKKAREALDLISGTKQRQASLYNLLGEDYTGPTEKQLEMMFRVFENNGKIGAQELASVLRAMGKRPLTKRIDKILNECDENKNGTIEMDEFIRYMQKKAVLKAKQLGLLEDDSEDEEVEEEEGGDTDEEKETTPKKKAAGATPKKKKAATSPKKKNSKKSTTTASTATTTTLLTKQPSFFTPLKKGSSIIQFYTENAGIHSLNNVEVDQFKNPVGNEYDLGIEGAFSDFTILFGVFYPLEMKCKESLKSKGFDIIITQNQKDFISKLGDADIAIIIPFKTADETTTESEFTSAVRKFHESGKGIFLWAENDPFFVQTNWILQDLLQTKVGGVDPGTKTLTLASGNKVDTQQFKSHLITSGIVSLYEGRTVSYFSGTIPESMDVLAKSSAGNPIILCSNNKLAANCGRIVVDTGYTKLLDEFFSAGIERYIKNACVWLLNLDHRFKLGVDIKSSIEKPVEIPVWQFKHGTWFNYDSDASKVCEEHYQEWLNNKYIDVRSIKSGLWSYNVDFNNMVQTNIQHSAHTQREIRRVLQNVVPNSN